MWTSPNGNPWPGAFGPGIDPAGCYTYTVTGTAPCMNDAATVCASVSQAPNAGINAAITICSDAAPFDLLSSLAGSPQPTGTWTFSGGPHPSIYDPATDSPGCYLYMVLGVAPCANSSATVCLTEVAAPNAGIDASVNWCQSSGTIALFAQLGGTPDAGGLWMDDNASGALTGASFAAGTVPPGTYSFTYTVGTAPCGPASSTVTVIVGPCLLPPGGVFPVE